MENRQYNSLVLRAGYSPLTATEINSNGVISQDPAPCMPSLAKRAHPSVRLLRSNDWQYQCTQACTLLVV